MGSGSSSIATLRNRSQSGDIPRSTTGVPRPAPQMRQVATLEVGAVASTLGSSVIGGLPSARRPGPQPGSDRAVALTQAGDPTPFDAVGAGQRQDAAGQEDDEAWAEHDGHDDDRHRLLRWARPDRLSGSPERLTAVCPPHLGRGYAANDLVRPAVVPVPRAGPVSRPAPRRSGWFGPGVPQRPSARMTAGIVRSRIWRSSHERPAVDVLEVRLDPAVELGSRAALDLPEPGDAGLHRQPAAVPEVVVGDLVAAAAAAGRRGSSRRRARSTAAAARRGSSAAGSARRW